MSAGQHSPASFAQKIAELTPCRRASRQAALPLCEGENEPVHFASPVSPSQRELCVRPVFVFLGRERKKGTLFREIRWLNARQNARFPRFRHTSPLAGRGFQHQGPLDVHSDAGQCDLHSRTDQADVASPAQAIMLFENAKRSLHRCT
jgi:hypothetical protein